MASAINELIKELPPPAEPEDAKGDWAAAEARLGTPFPDDYKQFVSIYGIGAISCELTILNPFAKNGYVNLFNSLRSIQEYARELEADGAIDGTPPFYIGGLPPFPSPGGLIPCAQSGNGDYILWRTRALPSTPNEWETTIDARQDLAHYDFPNTTFTELLLRLVRREVSEYKILLIYAPYREKNVPYEFLTLEQVTAKKQRRK